MHKQNIGKRIGSFLLACVMMFSLVGTAFAKYTGVKYPEKNGSKISENDFKHAKTHLSHSPIWVLSDFTDNNLEADCGNYDIFDAVIRAKDCGVALGYNNGEFRAAEPCTATFMADFIDRYFHETGIYGGTTLGGYTYDFSFRTSGGPTLSNGSSPMRRTTGILYAATEADYSSYNLSFDDFSSSRLGEWAEKHQTPNGGSSIKIYPHQYGGGGYENQTCEELGYFIPSDNSTFRGENCQAANFLMFAGVLKGYYNGQGLAGGNTLLRGQMVKLLVSLGDVLDSGIDVPEEVALSADLRISADDVTINYKDLDNGQAAQTQVVFDGSASEGEEFQISAYSYILDDLGVISTSSYATKTLSYPLRDILASFGAPVGATAKYLIDEPIADHVGGTITVTAGGEEATAQDETMLNIWVTNEVPAANFTVKTDRLTEYADKFFYVNTPITITDRSSDYEAPLKQTQYAILKDGAYIAVVTDFNEVDAVAQMIDPVKPNASSKTINVTFKTPGTYTIKAIATDECGAQNMHDQTIVVTGEPVAPTAIITTTSYAFINHASPIKDASTDANNDIVKWVWDDIQVEKTKDAGDWESATGLYAKTGLQNGTGITKPSSVDGSLTFNKKGLYQIGITVTDATGLHDATKKTIKIIESIPVTDVEVGPVNPNPGETQPSDDNGGYPYWDGDTLVVKQNRLFTLDLSKSLNPPDSPILWDKTEWSVNGIDGYAIDDLKMASKASTLQKRQYLSKATGDLSITITLHNKYSDDLAAKNPDNEDLLARITTVKVRVLPDVKPLVSLLVEGASPNFHDNPSAVNVKVVAAATSPDHDLIDYYDWTLVRDSNNNNNFVDDTVLQSIKKSKQSQLSLSVPFQSGNTSPFQATVKVTESFGQPTIDEFVSQDDRRNNQTAQIFDVNWRPCVSFSVRDFAYTDDVMTISTILRDENIESCKIDWTLWKRAGETYQQVNTSTLPVWALDLHGGQMQIPTDGYYRLQAVITDKEGNTETFYPAKDIRIYHLPVAVISDTPEYRWDQTLFQYKESRKFKLDGNASFVDDSTGKAMHQLDRNRDIWSITPLDGQKSENIYVMNDFSTGRLDSHDTTIFSVGANKFDETLAILEPGRYQVTYQVTNTFNKKSPVVTQVITIAEDTAPVITGAVEPVVKRGPEADGADVTLSIGNLEIQSIDRDFIDSYKIELVYDTNNDGQFTDETWRQLVKDTDYTVNHEQDGYVQLTVDLKRHEIGHYEFRVSAKDRFGQETLPIVPENKRKSTVKIWDVEIDNVAPTGTFSTRTVAKGDVVFAIGESSVTKEVQNATKTFKNKFGDEASLSVMDVNVEMVETVTSDMNLQNSFSWETDIDHSIANSFYITNNGSTIEMTGNPSLQGTNAIWVELPNATEEKFTFNYNIDFGDNFDAAGFLFNVKRTGQTLTGYALSFNNYSYSSSAGGANGAIWSFVYQIGQHAGDLNKQLVSPLNIQRSGTITVSFNEKAVTVSGGGLGGSQTINLPTVYGTGIGFFSDHYSHGCDMIGHFSLSGMSLQLTTVKQKNLADSLSDVSWRDGAERFVVYVDDKARSEMTPSSGDEYAKLMASLMGENIHLITLGSYPNASQLQALINNLSQSGAFYYNTPYTTALDRSAEFIKSVLLSVGKDTMYILLNDKLNYNKLYMDYNGDPQWLYEPTTYDEFEKNPSILAQRWKYYHNPTYYDNSLGTADFSSNAGRENWIAKEVNVFDKTGRYLIDYQIKDNPVPDKDINSPDNPFNEYRYWSQNYANDKKNIHGQITNPYAELYVHRKPLAEFSFVANNVNGVVRSVTVTNQAYDLDHQYNRSDKGLNLYEWKWKFASDSGWRGAATFTDSAVGQQWLNEQLVNLDSVSQTNILIQYRVRDVDGFTEKESVTETVKSGYSWVQRTNEYYMEQGAWSDAKTLWVTNKAQLPVARFKTSNNTYVVGETIGITDSSYSPNGDNIARWDFTVARNNGGTQNFTYYWSAAQMEINFSAALSQWVNSQPLAVKPEDNRYKITLVVTDDKRIPLSSDPYTVNIQIISINAEPTIDIPDKDNPDVPGGSDGNGTSIWGKNNPTVYEYDSYDANKPNPYYTVGGTPQKRGSEQLNWTLVLDDPDNHDNHGPANDTNQYEVTFKLDRFLSSNRTISTAEVSTRTYPTKKLTAWQARDNNAIAPFKTVRENNSQWGVYKITTSVTDIPLNENKGKTATMITSSDKKPLHLYVIPKLDVSNMHYTFNGILDNPERIAPGETIQVTTTTNDRSTGSRVVCRDGTGSLSQTEMTLASDNGNGTYTWSTNFTIPGDLDDDDLLSDNRYSFDIQTYTTYGSREGEETRQKNASLTLNILPLKLYDFRITGVTDPAVTYDSYPISVKDLAFDETDYNPLMKRGYAFQFELYSKGLKNNDDTVRIRPTFWGYNNGTGQYDIPLDMYYRNDDREYVKATTNPVNSAATGDSYQIYMKGNRGTLLGTLRELLLPKKSMTIEAGAQKWTARYGIPGTAVFVAKDQPLVENSLYQDKVLIMFDIEALKGGSPKYNYIDKGQWNLERRTSSGQYANTTKAHYKDGSVIIIDASKSSLDNYESRPVWTK